MDDLQTNRSKKGRRRSIRNLRRSSNVMPTANVSCLEPYVSEDGLSGDVSNIIHSYGSAWFGDENIDPLMVLKEATYFEQNQTPSLYGDAFVKAVKNDGDVSQVLSLPAKEQILSNFNFSETLDKPCVEDRSLTESRYDETGGIEKARSRLFSSPISSIRHGSVSSMSDSLPDLDLSLYGSVDDCLSTQPQESLHLPSESSMTTNKTLELNKGFAKEISQNCNLMHERDSKNEGSNMEVRDCFNDAFMDNCQDLLKLSAGTEFLDVGNNLKYSSSVSRSNGEFCLQPPANDVEMQLCEYGKYEPSSIPSPKVRKVSPENESLSGAVSSDTSVNLPGDSSSVNKKSSVLGITMLSAIQSITSRLEALSSISDAEEHSTSKSSTYSLNNTLLRCQAKSVPNFTKSNSKAAKSVDKEAMEKMNPVSSEQTSVSHLDQSCRSDLSQFHIQNDEENKSTVQSVKSRKRLSLNRRSNSGADDDKLSKSSSPKIVTESYCEKLEISESDPIVAASEECGDRLKECHSGYDSQPSTCSFNSDAVNVVENAKASTPIIDKEKNSDIAQAAASNSKLEETVLLEELSLRFPDDSMPSKVLKSRRSAGSSRRKSSRWLNIPSSGLNQPEQTIQLQQDFAEEVYLIENFDKHLDCAGEDYHSPGNSLSSSMGSSLNSYIDNDTLPGDQDNRREKAASTDMLEDNSCCEQIEYKEQLNVILCKTKSKRKGRRSGKFMCSHYDGKPQMSDAEIQMGAESNAIVSHNSSTNGDSVGDEIVEDLLTVAYEFGAEDRLAHSPSKEIDLSGTFSSIEEGNQKPSEFLGMNDASQGLSEKRTRSQRTCKRKSWVLPVASENSTSLREKQKRGGRKGVNKTKDNTAYPDIANQDETPKNTWDEFKVDEALRLLYLNKPYEAPPTMRSWETIKENPSNRLNVFSSKRHVRLLTFQEGLTHTRMVRRHRKATMLNELSQNKPTLISEEEFRSKMQSLERLLDP